MGCKSESFVCVRERRWSGRGVEAGVVCVCVCERERGDGSRGCLISKQMNNVSFITGMETERRPQQMLCLRERVILVV